jgi:hypothetical protein
MSGIIIKLAESFLSANDKEDLLYDYIMFLFHLSLDLQTSLE